MPAKLFLSGIGLFAAVCLFWFLSRPVSTESERGRVAEAPSPSVSGREPKVSKKAPQGSSSLVEPSVAQLDAVIAASNDKPATIIAAFLITNDSYFLKKLADFPNSSLACLFLATDSSLPEEKTRWSRQLQALEPENAMGWLLDAKEQLIFGDSKEGLAILDVALSKRAAVLPEKQVIAGLRSTFRGLGATNEEARKQSSNHAVARNFCFQLMAAGTAAWKAQSRNGQDQDNKIKAASQQIKLVHLIRNSISDGADAVISAYMAEQKVLKELPPDTEYGSEDYTVSQRLADMKSEHQAFGKRYFKVLADLKGATPARQEEFYDKVDLEGEAAAHKWFLETSK
jgi:hypothetical protein